MVATGYAGGGAAHNHDGEYAEPVHAHAQADVTGLPASLAGKSDTSHNHDASYSATGHGHAQGDVTGLTASLAGKSDTSHNHDASYSASGHGHLGAYAPALSLAPEPGKRWYLTDDPFDGTLIGQLVTGDRFTYPLGHASERETYRWDGDSWEFDQLLPAMPTAADAVIYGVTHDHTGTYSPVAHNHDASYSVTGHNHSGTYSPVAHTHDPGAGSDITPATNIQHGTGGNAKAVEVVPGYVMLYGRLQATAAGSANQQIGTIPSGLRPDREVRPTVRFIGASASTGAITIGTNGVMTYNTALANTNEVPLDGIMFRKA